MVFNSIEFTLFFIMVTTAYFAFSHQYRWLLLLLSSCYFYMAFVPVYILILGITIVVDYYAGIYLEHQTGYQRKWFLIASLIVNLGVLATFKYYNFVNDSLSTFTGGWGYQNPIPALSILLPIGLSFHTFQAMSYTIEVYRGNQKAERHFGIYALYVMFYPQLVAGPIERPQNILHQFHERHHFNYPDVVEGLKRMLWGFVKKLVVADRLAVYVDTVYNDPNQHNGITLLVATIFFSIQIYCDFSGYSDIAIGAARVMSFRLMENFKRPYFAQSIAEFWSRWHVSLSTWFRDYVYIPLGGNRVSFSRWYMNLLLVFTLSGLWHGANWTYVIWGGLNGFYLISALLVQRVSPHWPGRLQLILPLRIQYLWSVLTTFGLISVSWVFFRANSVSDAFSILTKIAHIDGKLYISSPSTFIYSLIGIAILLTWEAKQEFYRGQFSLLHNPNWLVRQASYVGLILLILLIGVFDGGQFIYFQF